MNRRVFVQYSILTGAGLASASSTFGATVLRGAHAARPVAPKAEVCVMHAEEITAESMGYTRYAHFHTLALPIHVLIQPPSAGFKIRCSPLDPDSLDVEAIDTFLKETGLSDALRSHSHLVSFTQDQLNRIAAGEARVKISVLSPLGNFAHEFYFTAPASALIKVKRARAVKV